MLRVVLCLSTFAVGSAAACASVDTSAPDVTDGGAVSDSGVKPPPPYGDGSASACAPASLNKFEPEWSPPAALGRAACSPTQLESFGAACATLYADGCGAYRVATATDPCTKCIFELSTEKKEGPLVASGLGHLLPNRAGCLADITGDSSRSGCAAAYQALAQCQLAACATNCPVSNDKGDQDFMACADAAAQNACKVYAGKVAECTVTLRGDASAGVLDCLDGNDLTLVKLFCGKYDQDGGT